MKLTILVILISTFSMVASRSFSQDAKVDLNIENGTFKEVLLGIHTAPLLSASLFSKVKS
jgi:hypothetical protein